MTSIFFKDKNLNKWRLIKFGWSKKIARDYAQTLRQSGYEAFVGNRSLISHWSEVTKRFKYAQI